MNQNKRYTKPYTEQGITLVALAVTIIILLILAGITIASLTGDNGLIGKSGEAKKQAEISEGLEQLEIVVTQSTNKRGNIDTTKLAKNLSKINGLKYINAESQEVDVSENTDIKLTAKVKLKGNTFKINDEGNVSYKKEGAIDNEDIMNSPSTYYGKYVTNYNSLSDAGIKDGNGQLGKWQIFLADDTNIYLIASNAISKSFAPLDYDSNDGYGMSFTNILNLYDTSIQTNPSVESILSKLSKQEEYFEWLSNATLYNQDNQKAVLSMLDTDKWNDYMDGTIQKGYRNTTYADYAIGGPSLEMFYKSYNSTHEGGEVTTKCKNNNGIYYRYGYTVKKGDSNESGNCTDLNKTGNVDIDTMQFKCNYFLASPGNMYLGISYINGYVRMYEAQCNNYFCFRPVVCLKSNVHLVKNADGETYSLELD